MRVLPTILALCLAASGSGQTTFTETFSGGSNEGGWWFGVPGVVKETSGGDPGAWLHEDLVDTFAPSARTRAGSGQFLGDYRARNVTALHADLRVLSTQFPYQREATLMLVNYKGTPLNGLDDEIVYFLGTELVPEVAEGWKSFTWDVPADSPSLPPGWSVLQGNGTPNQIWFSTTSSVDQVRLFFGDPELFYVFDQWDVGLDDVGITIEPIVTTYCTAKTSSQGCVPTSQTQGVPSATLPTSFVVGCTDVPNQKPGLLFYGFSLAGVPFAGGVLCVSPPLQRTGIQSSGGNPPPDDCSGSYGLDFNAIVQAGAPGLLPGVDVFCQHWMRDPAVDPTGIVLSDGSTFLIQP